MTALMVNLDRDLVQVGWVAVLSDGTFGAFRKRKPSGSGWVPMYAHRDATKRAATEPRDIEAPSQSGSDAVAGPT